MTLRFAELFADVRSMWRGERDLLAAVAGVFFVIPILGLMLLLNTSGFGKDLTPEQFQNALIAFQTANIVPIVLASVALDFGTFAVLNLYLQGGGRTLGEVLRLTAYRFVPFVIMSLLAGTVSSIGFSLFILPGLFVLARTWLAAPALAAAPERGLLAAFREGWRRSGGVMWLLILATAGLTLLPMLFAGLFITTLVTGLAIVAGAGSEVSAIIGSLVMAVIGAGLWVWLAILRIAFYRATEPSSGM